MSIEQQVRRQILDKLEMCELDTTQFHNSTNCRFSHSSLEYLHYYNEWKSIQKGFSYYHNKKIEECNLTSKPIISMGSAPHTIHCEVFLTKTQLLNENRFLRRPECTCDSPFVPRPVLNKEMADIWLLKEHFKQMFWHHRKPRRG